MLFELGLFMGRIGRHRTFIVQEKDADLKIPSDLAGITTTPYRKRENLSAALSPACTPIIKAIRSLGQTDEHRSAEIQGDLLPNLLVEIFWTVDGERGKIATGVAIGSNHILTAAHILDDSNGSFEIRWNMGNNWQDASMVWTGEDEGFDLVVLNVNSPFDLPSELTPHIISSSAPAAGTFWYGAGFARALRREEKRSEPLPMSGNVCPIARHGSGFQLDVDIGPREEMGWAGAGGAPILIGNKLYGTVSHVVAGFGGRRLVATSLWRLLENQKFRHALGL